MSENSMSTRNFRRVADPTRPTEHPDSDDSDNDPTRKEPPKKTTYEGLQISTDSEAEKARASDDEAQAALSIAHGGARKKKPTKKKEKKKKKKKPVDPEPSTSTANDGHGEGTSSSASHVNTVHHPRTRRRNSRLDEMDEIDRSVMEVNALLGPPPAAPVQQKPVRVKSILDVQAKHLNVGNEMKRLFGPDDPEDVRLRSRTQPHRPRILRRVLVTPATDTVLYDFRKTGMTMSIVKRDNEVMYFVYDHDEHHRKMHDAFLQKYATNLLNQEMNLFNLDDARKFMHVEPLLEITDSLFRIDEHSLAVELVENMVTYLQNIAHPSFNLANPDVRLLYTYNENRPFHVVMLKYVYLLSNRACHRTALEVAKMLMNLDPGDPLAVLFIIDTLALRAREHQWFIDAVEFLNDQRQACLLFNIQYSLALAHFHVALKAKKDTNVADMHLQKALLSYPMVAVSIIEFGSFAVPGLTSHRLFTESEQSSDSEGLKELIMIHAKLIWPKWREPKVKQWFVRNILIVANSYNMSPEVQFRSKQLAVLRHSIFQAWPAEILRHVTVIRSMANLLIDTPLSPSTRLTCSWDPLFDRGVNRYGYTTPAAHTNIPDPGGRSLLYRFFTSMIPNQGLDPPVND